MGETPKIYLLLYISGKMPLLTSVGEILMGVTTKITLLLQQNLLLYIYQVKYIFLPA